MMRWSVIFVAFTVLSAVSGRGDPPRPPTEADVGVGAGTVVDVLSADPRLNTFRIAIREAGLRETLSAAGPFTLFAPTDEAFRALPDGEVAKLLKPENRQSLIDLLTHHVVRKRLTADGVEAVSFIEPMSGRRLNVSDEEGEVRINGAKILRADAAASNGFVHVIDRVWSAE